MPSGRLTFEDRQHIASALSEGHPYAEIAKTLGRPTSTVTREVARNGGPGGYQAREAQEATMQRARQRIATATNGHRGARKAAHGFEEQFSTLLSQTGIPRMMAKVLACLYATDTGSVTAAELASRLQVSPASISNAIAYLEAQQLVTRERDDRRDRYLLVDNGWYRAMLEAARTNVMIAEAARLGAQTLGISTPAGARLESMALFLEQTSDDLIQSVEHRRHVLDTAILSQGR